MESAHQILNIFPFLVIFIRLNILFNAKYFFILFVGMAAKTYVVDFTYYCLTMDDGKRSFT